jgi:hypothetical protein
VSLVVAVLAFLVAVYAGYQSKRSRIATEKQAVATNNQAELAARQLEESQAATYQALEAAKEAKVVTWHDISDRLMERTAKVVVGVERVEGRPIYFKENSDEDEPKYPISASPDQPKIITDTFFEDRFSEIYYWVRGVIFNEDSRPIQFIPLGPVQLLEGASGLVDGEFKVPPKMHPREERYLLAPGRAALFEWRASLNLEQWIEVFKESDRAQTLSVVIFSYPAGQPDIASAIKIDLEDACPVSNYHTRGTDKWEINDGAPYVNVKPPRLVPPEALTQLFLSLDKSGMSPNDLKAWGLDPWQRYMLDLW